MKLNPNRDEEDAAHKAGKAAGVGKKFFSRIFGKEERATLTDASLATSSTNPSCHSLQASFSDASGSSHTGNSQGGKNESSNFGQSLWDLAFEALGEKQPGLVADYEKLLTKEAQSMST
jgi:hypothetical protein